MTPCSSPDLPYELHLPKQGDTCAIFASPHSGRLYTEGFQSASILDLPLLRSSEDAFVDLLSARAPECGAPLLRARFPRAYVDLNRDQDELDPALIADLARKGPIGARVAAGLGVIPRVVAGGRAIYHGKISRAEAELRLATVWRPWHAQLNSLIAMARARHGEAILFDMHSMPGEALDHLGANCPQIVLGDLHGTSAARQLSAQVMAAFEAEGFSVLRNTPFAGAYVAHRYGRPARGQHVMQIEIDRALYMDEARIAPRPDFDAFADRIGRVIARLCLIGRQAGRLAAE